MDRLHRYDVTVRWTGDRGTGTSSYRAYDRDTEAVSGRRPALLGSSDPAFRGDPARWSPEDLLVASLSQCHLLWYLHLAAAAGVVVTSYDDDAQGLMAEDADGSGVFTEVVLRPRVGLADPARQPDALRLHGPAHERCFVARSVAFPVRVEPVL